MPSRQRLDKSLPPVPPAARPRLIRDTAASAAVCIAFSILVCFVGFSALGFPHDLPSYGMAVVVPALTATPASFWMLSQLERMREAYRQLDRLAATDSLTGCLNRRAFREIATTAGRTTGALLIADADRFKSINDRFGHDVGDEALRAIAAAVRASVRDADIVGRIGGEEFGILLPDADLEMALNIAGRIRRAVRELAFSAEGQHWPLSISIGGACHTANTSFTDLFRAADQRLYAVKRSGRDGVDIAATPEEEAAETSAAA